MWDMKFRSDLFLRCLLRMSQLCAVGFAASLSLWQGEAQDVEDQKRAQHQMIVGSKECIECHESEVEAWHRTEHYFNKDLHKDEKAIEIAQKMGITSPAMIQKSALCTQCHFTVQQVGTAPAQVISGVSCESCHGGAKDWLDIHNAKDRREGEDSSAQIASATEKGMLYPHEIDKVAANCFSCHIVTNEDLVNIGGHPAGSDDFELVSWLKGEVRHNFFDSKGAKNAETPIERQRVQFVIGKMLEMEYSLRGLARASKSDYGNAMGRRCVSTRKQIEALVELLGDNAGALGPMLEKISVPGLLKFGNTDALQEAADAVEAAAGEFEEAHDGSQLGSVDPIIPDSGKGDVYQP
ncbi:MAG: hypothetical protein CMO55_28780 [Verrucomicrobiales bacterium]|nr:hypothetical protein [Verrucomicrobiales bacterium]